MNLATVRKMVTAGSALAALTLISLVIAKYWFYALPNPGAQSASVPLEAKSSTEAEFSFTLLEELRALPELRFVDGDGRALTIADFRGRLVLLNIWATWCVPCRREMPTLDRLQAKLGGPDFEVLALSIDRQGLPVVKAFYEELGLRALRVYVDASTNATRDLGVVGIPTTLLIDPKGNEIGRLVGPSEWDRPEMISFLGEQINKADRARASATVRSTNDQTQENANERITIERIFGRACPGHSERNLALHRRQTRSDRPGNRDRGRWNGNELGLAGRSGYRSHTSGRPPLRGDVRPRAVHENGRRQIVLFRRQDPRRRAGFQGRP